MREHQEMLEKEKKEEENKAIRRSAGKIGRNDACPCGSGKKYKACHGV